MAVEAWSDSQGSIYHGSGLDLKDAVDASKGEISASKDPGIAQKDEISALATLTRFYENTTAHGVPHVVNAKGIPRKIMWSSISILMLGLLIYNGFANTTKYLSYPVNVKTSIKRYRVMPFPAVTVCNANGYKNSSIERLKSELGADALEFAPAVNRRVQLLATIQEMMAGYNVSEKKALGFAFNQLVLSCDYAGSTCYNSSFFNQTYDAKYGNCYTFNWNQNDQMKLSKRSGPSHGLRLVLDINLDEYSEFGVHGVGIRVLVHHQNTMPFPDERGISIAPGQLTYVSINKLETTVLPEPFGLCIPQGEVNWERNVYEELQAVGHSITGCLQTCYQAYLMKSCGCSDSTLPNTGQAFLANVTDVCKLSNANQARCMNDVKTMYEDGDLECGCPNACRDISYNPTIFSVPWPSDANVAALSTRFKEKGIPRIDQWEQAGVDIGEAMRQNLAQLMIYFNDFSVQEVTEIEAYAITDFLSDFGGILGLYAGFSVLTILELIELVMDIFVMLSLSIISPRIAKK